MPDTTDAGLPVPTLGDANNPPADFLSLGQALDKVTIPRFDSITARDAAFPSPDEGQHCYVDGLGDNKYTAGNWVRLTAPPLGRYGVTQPMFGSWPSDTNQVKRITGRYGTPGAAPDTPSFGAGTDSLGLVTFATSFTTCVTGFDITILNHEVDVGSWSITPNSSVGSIQVFFLRRSGLEGTANTYIPLNVTIEGI